MLKRYLLYLYEFSFVFIQVLSNSVSHSETYLDWVQPAGWVWKDLGMVLAHAANALPPWQIRIYTLATFKPSAPDNFLPIRLPDSSTTGDLGWICPVNELGELMRVDEMHLLQLDWSQLFDRINFPSHFASRQYCLVNPLSRFTLCVCQVDSF